MTHNLSDNYNSIILSLATCGGMITDKGSMRVITISVQRKDKDGLDDFDFQEYTVTTSELQELLAEANTLRQEIKCMVEHEEEELKRKEEEKAAKREKKLAKKPSDEFTKKKKDSTPESLFRFGDDEPDDYES